MSQLTPEIPFMASLWIRSGCDMKVDPSVETYQVGAHFKALIKAILVAPSRILENFFSFHVSLLPCGRPSLTQAISSSFAETTEEPGRSQVKKLKLKANIDKILAFSPD